MKKRPFREALAEAARLGHELTEHKWRLGDIAAEQVEDEGPSDRLARLAAAAGVSTATMTKYRRTAMRFSPEQRQHPGVPFSVYAELAARDDRLDLLAELVQGGRVTVDVARERIGNVPGRFAPPPRDTDGKVALVRDALADPNVAEAVVRDGEARRAVERARDRVEAEEWNSPEARRRREEGRRLLEPTIRHAATMSVPWTDQKLAEAAKLVRELVEDDAYIAERYLTAWQGHVKAIATDLAVYCARHDGAVDFAAIVLGENGGES